jgi:tetratricopeptide (TPR) repeat protein
MRKRSCVIAAMALVCFLAGCVVMTPPYWRGHLLLKNGRYGEAIEKFELALRETPDDVRAQCELGIANYKEGKYGEAISALSKAKAIDPGYGKVYLYLGLTYEKMNDPIKALDEYFNYMRLGPASLMARKIKRRIKEIMKQQCAARTREMTEDELALYVDSIPENSIAVTYFENVSGSEELTPLQKGLTDMLITDLSQVKALKVLERMCLHVLLEEMRLGTTGILDKMTAPKAGRLLGANRIVTGSFATPGKDNMRIDSFLVKPRESKLEASEDVSGALQRFFDLEKQLVFKMIAGMGIRLSPEEEDAIKKVPTESFMAFLAYSRGLDYEDRGMYVEAAAEFEAAVALDPSFSNAQTKMQEMQQEVLQPVTEESVDAQVLERTQEQLEERETIEEMIEPVPQINSASRLSRISGNTGEGLPQIDEGKRIIPQANTNVVNIAVEWE